VPQIEKERFESVHGLPKNWIYVNMLISSNTNNVVSEEENVINAYGVRLLFSEDFDFFTGLVTSPESQSSIRVFVIDSPEQLSDLSSYSGLGSDCIAVSIDADGWTIGPLFARNSACCPECWVLQLQSVGLTTIGSARKSGVATIVGSAASLPAALHMTINLRHKELAQGRRYRCGFELTAEPRYIDSVCRHPYCHSCSVYHTHANERFLEVL
jgi:hypothetical protein